MKVYAGFLLIIVSISLISAVCEDGQVDVNSASAEELDELYGIGEVKAQAIIDTRPFSTLEELINVNGIGEVTLANIKAQGLACVEEKIEEEGEEIEEKDKAIEEVVERVPTKIELETIDLNPKAIKSEENSEDLDKRNYSGYGLAAFVVLLGLLFLIKTRKGKNEFTE